MHNYEKNGRKQVQHVEDVKIYSRTERCYDDFSKIKKGQLIHYPASPLLSINHKMTGNNFF